ncbi:MAG: glycosyltransferase, partial [Pseudomonadota bacterium]
NRSCRLSMRVAHICPILPARHGNGLAMRTSMFAEAAAGLGEALIVVIGSHQGPVPDHDISGASIAGIDGLSRPDTKLMLISKHATPDQRPDLLRQYGRPSASVMLSLPVMQETVNRLQQHQPDVIVISRSYLLPLVDPLKTAFPNVPVIADLDDDDGELHRSYAVQTCPPDNRAERRWHEAEADMADSQITSAARDVAMFTCASDLVANGLQQRLRLDSVRVVRNAVPDRDPFHKPGSANGELLFLGNLSYWPNIDGLQWFLTGVWPDLQLQFPDIRLVVAGSNPDAAVRQMCSGNNVELVADPDHVAPLYQRAAATVVPLRLGSGSRIKILEAGQYGTAVITTDKGSEGLKLDAEKHAFVCATRTDEMLAACIDCLSDRQLAQQRADALQSFVRQHHDRKAIIGEIRSLMRDTLTAPAT